MIKSYDVIIIGGGINGAAIANLAAEQGLKVALLEKGDFAGGTSSKSTKLIHGGLRYLENFEFDLVRESLKERAVQLKSAPHLVKPLGFIVPVYKKDRRPLWMMKVGVFLYDFLSGAYCIKKHRSLNVAEVRQAIPGIKDDGLTGAVMYYDAQMDDARLCLENVLSARAKGVEVFNYTEVRGFLKENLKAIGVKARDVLTQADFDLKAKKIVCAVGPWTNFLLKLDHRKAFTKIRTTKGVHLIYKKELSKDALFIQSSRDNRIFFIIPWHGHSLIGTTDTDYNGHPDEVRAEEEDINYLLEETQRIFPGETLTRNEIVTTFAGLRPLVNDQGAPSDISRKAVIEQTPTGLIYVIGGKYTTYRKIAQDCVRQLLPGRSIEFSEDYAVYGSGILTQSPEEIAQSSGLDEEIVHNLINTYGARYQDVLELTKLDPKFKERICDCTPTIAAQIVYSIETEMAKTADDIIWRRLGLGYRFCETKRCREIIKGYTKGR